MPTNHQSTNFKQNLDIMMPDTSLFDGKSDPKTNLYKWHVALAFCLFEINQVVYLGWLDYFIDTASSDEIKLLAAEASVPDDVFRYDPDIEVLRKSLKAKNRILNGIVMENDLKDIAKMFKIEKLSIEYGIDGAYFDNWIFAIGADGKSDLGLPLFEKDDEPYGFLTIHLPNDLKNNQTSQDSANRFEILIQKMKSSYARLTFIYDL